MIISQTDGRPMYLQIMEQIKQRIALGDWPPGMLLPSIRQLAVDTRVSVITIKRAYLELEREGVILTQHGKGSMVAETPNLGPRLHEQEFSQHLEHTLRLAALMGLSQQELLQRIEAAYAPVMEERT